MSDRMIILVNSDAKMSRGKYAAAAVHAALLSVGAHHDGPVIVLGGKRSEVEAMSTVVFDAGKTEVGTGTATAGTDFGHPEPELPA